jgi:hypothetical protein
MTPSVETRNLARRLLDYETAAVPTSLPAESAALRVYEKLRRSLSALVGVAGCRSLFSRALTLARAEAPALNSVQLAADGTLQGFVESYPQDAHKVGEGEVLLVAQLLGLLLTFMGEAITMRLITPDILPRPSFVYKGTLPIDYEAILNEVDQLQGVSMRLEELAEQNPPVTEALVTIASGVRNTATVLSVLVTIKSSKPN